VRQVLCPVLVGRDGELAELDAALQAARIGHGRVVVLTGEAGIGKSRLAQALAARARLTGVTVGTGRAVEAATQLAFRPLGEALHAVVREQGPPADPELRPFRAVLSLFVSEWAQDGARLLEPGLVMLEGIHRLVRSAGKAHGLLLVLEDLHWSDADTLAAVEYLADNIGSERVLCLCTVRSGVPGGATDKLVRLAGRRAVVPVELGRLPDDQVEQMARATLGTEAPSPAVLDALRRRAEGVPFLVEEMLSAYVAAGGEPDASAEWWIARRIVEALPPSLRDLVRGRLRSLDQAAQAVVCAAAVLGRTFDWPLVAPITGLDRAAVLGGLRAAVAAQLLVGADGHDVDAFSFRHALMREAVLGELLPPERAELSHRAANAIEDHPSRPARGVV
jgi:predicted ATPase